MLHQSTYNDGKICHFNLRSLLQPRLLFAFLQYAVDWHPIGVAIWIVFFGFVWTAAVVAGIEKGEDEAKETPAGRMDSTDLQMMNLKNKFAHQLMSAGCGLELALLLFSMRS